MTVRVVGEGPAVDAVLAALADVDVPVETSTAEELDDASLADADLAVVAATTGDDLLERVVDGAERAVAIELGGVGDHAVEGVEASIFGSAPGTACYSCLCTRVAANADHQTAIDDETVPDDAGASDATTARFAGATAGREIVRRLAGDDRVSGTVLELPHAHREVLPVPGCECETRAANDDGSGGPDDDESEAANDAASEAPADTAGSRSLPIPREYAERDLEETVALMDRAIDERVGIVGQLGEIDSFPAPYYLTTLADTSPFSDGSGPDKAAGVADDWNEALARAVGEGLERYAASIYREAAFENAPAQDVRDPVLPSDFAVSPDSPLDPETVLPWSDAEVLVRDGTVLDSASDDEAETVRVPAGAVHFPAPSGSEIHATTTGLGLGSSPVDALRTGLLEVIERDAAMLAWYSSFEPLELAVDDPAFVRLARRARSEGLTVTPLLVTQDADVPVVSVALHREDGDWPKFAVAADAALDPAEAATGALAEALQNWMELRSAGPDAAADFASAIGDYAQFPEGARDFVDVDQTVPASEVGPDDPPTGAAALDATLEAVADAELDAYAARLTTRDVEALGFDVVRVLVPEAQPLFTQSPRFGDRAERVPQELGFEPDLERPHHPYP